MEKLIKRIRKKYRNLVPVIFFLQAEAFLSQGKLSEAKELALKASEFANKIIDPV